MQRAAAKNKKYLSPEVAPHNSIQASSSNRISPHALRASGIRCRRAIASSRRKSPSAARVTSYFTSCSAATISPSKHPTTARRAPRSVISASSASCSTNTLWRSHSNTLGSRHALASRRMRLSLPVSAFLAIHEDPLRMSDKVREACVHRNRWASPAASPRRSRDPASVGTIQSASTFPSARTLNCLSTKARNVVLPWTAGADPRTTRSSSTGPAGLPESATRHGDGMKSGLSGRTGPRMGNSVASIRRS